MNRRLGAWWLALALVAAVAAAMEVEVLQPQHRVGADLLAAVQAAVGNEGTVTLDQRTGALVVTGTAGAIARAKKVLAELDTAPRTVRIDLSTIAETDLTNLGVNVDWSTSAGVWRIGRLRDTQLTEDGRLRVHGQVTQRLYRSADAARQMIRVLEGETAVLVSGGRTDYEPTHLSWSQTFGARLSGDITHVQVSLMARPRIVGEYVQLDITPQLTTFGAEGMRVQQVMGMATTVRVKNGETVLLGGSSTQGQLFTADLLRSLSVGASQSNVVMMLTVRIEQ